MSDLRKMKNSFFPFLQNIGAIKQLQTSPHPSTFIFNHRSYNYFTSFSSSYSYLVDPMNMRRTNKLMNNINTYTNTNTSTNVRLWIKLARTRIESYSPSLTQTDRYSHTQSQSPNRHIKFPLPTLYCNNTSHSTSNPPPLSFMVSSTAIGLAALYYITKSESSALTESSTITNNTNSQNITTSVTNNHATDSLHSSDDLPVYSVSDVSSHRSAATGIWVSYQGNVYDVTNWCSIHPGGASKIMLAAGGSIEPFWSIYKQHHNKQVLDILNQMLIGRLDQSSIEANQEKNNLDDPYRNEPIRHPVFEIVSPYPYNAEPPSSLLTSSYLTPNDLFFVRNHLPVPLIDISNYRLEITGKGLNDVSFSLEELKNNFPQHTITATLQCAGNRRHELSTIKPIKGLDWKTGAISTAEWTGVKLKDILNKSGLNEESIRHNDSSILSPSTSPSPSISLSSVDLSNYHVEFEGCDSDPLTGTKYAASIPVVQAISNESDCLLAHSMNGVELPRDHGYPLRVIIPGIVGARAVKWLKTIRLRDEESESHWQRKDYKSFPPTINWENVDWDSAPTIQQMPVQSAITDATIHEDGNDLSYVNLSGYAWSGGGRRIVRVDVSADGGKTWQVAPFIHQIPKEGINNRIQHKDSQIQSIDSKNDNDGNNNIEIESNITPDTDIISSMSPEDLLLLDQKRIGELNATVWKSFQPNKAVRRETYI